LRQKAVFTAALLTDFTIIWPNFKVTSSINGFMGILRQFAEYLYIRKRDPNAPRSQSLKYMHGMNRISILMFLICLLVITYRLFVKR
jgi:hypothetical protein